MSIENPPAFPNTGNSNWNLTPDPGMTLRDYFAGKALEAICPGWNQPAKEVASRAYAIADAMLTARQKGTPDE